MFNNKRLIELEKAVSDMECRFASVQNQIIPFKEEMSELRAHCNAILSRADRATDHLRKDESYWRDRLTEVTDAIPKLVCELVAGHLQHERDGRNHQRCAEAVQWLRPDLVNTDVAMRVMEFILDYKKAAPPVKSKRKSSRKKA